MNRIILIGNGFDLAHGLKTSYANFIDWYWGEWGNKLLHSNNKVERDQLCSFKLNDALNLGMWFYAWQGFYYKRSNPFVPWDVQEVAKKAKQDRNLCKFNITSGFFQEICSDLEKKGWVDIENEYYRLLFPSDNKRPFLYLENAKSLNDELAYIRDLLIEYLKTVQEKYISDVIVNQDIKEKMYSPFNLKDFSINGIQKWSEFVHDRFQNDSYIKWGDISDWDELFDAYDVDVIDRSQSKVEIKNFVKSYQEQVAYMGIESIVKNEFPKHFLLPDRIMLLNFNYTNTADLYLRKNERFVINHIHGNLNEPEGVIFGYGDELDENYKKMSEKNDNEYLRNIKSVKYLESPNYRNLLEFIESSPYQIIIMGHSCGNSDRTLLNTLFEHKNCVSIKPFYHKWSDGTDNYMELVQNISRNFTDMKLMRDRVVNKTFCETI